MTQELLF